MTTAPCIQWPGSKARIAPKIVALMREHGAYVEPFAGSLAVLLAKEPCPVEVINDQHDLLVTFYRVLRDQEYELVRSLMLTPYSRKVFNEEKYDDPALPDLERARRFFIRYNQAFVSSNGTGSWTATNHSSAGHSNASKWARFQSRLYIVAERLTGVQIECADAMDVLKRLTRLDKRGVVYCDPPYLDTTRNGSHYHHDMGTVEEHEALLEELQRVAGTQRQVLISGYANELYDERLAGWDRHILDTTRNTSSGKGSKKQEEVLWISPLRRSRTVQRR